MEDYRRVFVQRHPEAGELKVGTLLKPHQAAELGEVFRTKISELGRKPELTFEESLLIDNVLDLGSRNIIWSLEKGSLRLPPEKQDVINLQLDIFNVLNQVSSRKRAASFAYDKHETCYYLTQLAGANIGVRQYPQLRTEIVGIAETIMPFFGNMFEPESQGIVIDNQLAENLAPLLARYEQVEEQSASGEMYL